MTTLATIGVRIRVTPWDDIWIVRGEDEVETVEDRTPFEFQVEGWLEDGQIFYGLYGPVVAGPERYHNLICNITVRVDGSDWRKSSRCSANFTVGPSIVTRCHRYDFRHPDGLNMEGYPIIGKFGEIRVVSMEGSDAVI